MKITMLKCFKCHKEYPYDFPVWCQGCLRFISVKVCVQCHNKKYHYEDFHLFSYSDKVKRALQ